MPVKFPCKVCKKPVKRNQNHMFCTECNTWLHRKCTDMTVIEHINLNEETYVCPLCELADCFTSESEDEPSETDISDCKILAHHPLIYLQRLLVIMSYSSEALILIPFLSL